MTIYLFVLYIVLFWRYLRLTVLLIAKSSIPQQATWHITICCAMLFSIVCRSSSSVTSDQNACWLVIVRGIVNTMYIYTPVLPALLNVCGYCELTQCEIPDYSTNIKAEWHDLFRPEPFDKHVESQMRDGRASIKRRFDRATFNDPCHDIEWRTDGCWMCLSFLRLSLRFGYGSMRPKVLNSWKRTH